jgi:hypothetical protein
MTSDLTQDRTDAATCMEAAVVLRGRRLTALVAEHTTPAVAQLLSAVSLALAADGRSVPPTVRRAALRVADQLQRPPSVSSSGGVAADDVAPPDRRSAQCRRSGPQVTRIRPVPYVSSVKLGRMG